MHLYISRFNSHAHEMTRCNRDCNLFIVISVQAAEGIETGRLSLTLQCGLGVSWGFDPDQLVPWLAC